MSGNRPNASGRAWPAGWHVEHVAETTSTNNDLVSAAEHGAADRSVLVADYQTAGRGRLDRRWDTPRASNLLVSILFRDAGEHPWLMSQRVGLAAIGAARDIAGVEAGLKWPNDLLVGEQKLAGILAQRAADGSVVVGIGLNVRWAPDGAAMLGDDHDPLEVLASMLQHLDALPDDVTELYRRSLVTLGKRVSVETPRQTITGTATGVDDDGRLIVLDACGLSHHLDVGDVIHLR